MLAGNSQPTRGRTGSADLSLYSEVDTFGTALRVVRAQGVTTKVFTSKGGNLHTAKPLGKTGMRLLLFNVLYVGSVSHKGTTYAGEHEAIVDQQLWDTVNEKLQLNSVHVRGKRHHKQNALLAKLLYCSSCNGPMVPTYTSKSGQPLRYYMCGASSRREKTCGQRPVSATDLETALTRQLQPMLGNQLSAPVIQQSLQRIVYDSHTRRVSTTMRDGTGFEFLLAAPNRGGVRRSSVETNSGRIPRISQVLALAIKIERLIREGVARNYSDAALLGHISGCRMSQIMLLRELAPAIQEELLFLPKTLSGPDRLYERALREIAQVIDWERQMEMFRLLIKNPRNLRFLESAPPPGRGAKQERRRARTRRRFQ